MKKGNVSNDYRITFKSMISKKKQMILFAANLKLACFFPLLWRVCFYGNGMNSATGNMFI